MTRLIQSITGSRPVRRLADTVLNRYANLRVRDLDQVDPIAAQARDLRRLVQRARHTQFGRDHDFPMVRTIEDFQKAVPLRTYEQMWDQYWGPVYPRLAGVSWPDYVPYYALSSGTTSGNTKYVPVTREMVASNKKAALLNLAFFLKQHPRAPIFRGRIFFLGGSTDLKVNDDGSLVGDLSGISAREVSSPLRPYLFPPPEIALMGNWDQKVKVLAEQSAKLPVTVLSGVPSWVLTLFEYLKQATGKKHIVDIWPTLQMVIHGGALFDPYRRVFRDVIGSDQVQFQDTYPASEAYIGVEDPRHGMLRLIVDHGVFYEFVPVAELDSPNPTRHTLATAQTGVQYAIVLTTCAGLWGYVLGDTIRFESLDPPLFRFTGRTKYFLSAFGEHLISEEVEKAVSQAAEATRALVVDFHVGPVFPAQPKEPGRHRYLIEFAKEPDNLTKFTEKLDALLQQLNKDYYAYRVGSISVGLPEVWPVRHGGFADWMRSRGKFGGQHKVPRMDNSGTITRELEQFVGGDKK
jgi:hypothetical protein